MYDLVSVGATNIDMYYKGGSVVVKDGKFDIACGSKYFVDFFHETIGGGATNVAIGAAKLGMRVSLVTEIGQNAYKRVIFEKLDLHAISYKHCLLSHEFRNYSTVLLNKDGDRAIINYRTPHTDFLKVLPPDDLFTKAKCLYLGHVPQVSVYHRTMLLRAARKHRLTTYLTLGSDDLSQSYDHLADLVAHTDVLFVNREEFAEYVRMNPNDLNLHDDMMRIYRHVPLPSLLVITDGAGGSYAYDGHSVMHQPSIQVSTVVDSTGAGDGFCAGFIVSYEKNKHITAALNAGARYAAQKLGHLGAN
ncbi:MAG: carbohydrate kinase family protein [Candidatus Roizmanbacteria bacterium]